LADSSAALPPFDEQALMRGVASVRHPLTRSLLVLTFTTGIIDAVSFLGLGHVFTANMTGNVVLLGFGLAGSSGLPVVAPIVSLAFFLVGAAAGGLLVNRIAEHHLALIPRALGAEACLLAVATLVAAVVSVRTGSFAADSLIAVMALAMGVRNATTRHIAVPDVTTTVLTGTLTNLASGLTAAGRSGQGTLRRLAAVVTMLVGGLVGALLVETSLVVPLAIAAGLALATLVFYVPAAARLGARP
jgi:uncharacterized membrane protein YoaK (UPF0700 family)